MLSSEVEEGDWPASNVELEGKDLLSSTLKGWSFSTTKGRSNQHRGYEERQVTATLRGEPKHCPRYGFGGVVVEDGTLREAHGQGGEQPVSPAGCSCETQRGRCTQPNHRTTGARCVQQLTSFSRSSSCNGDRGQPSTVRPAQPSQRALHHPPQPHSASKRRIFPTRRAGVWCRVPRRRRAGELAAWIHTGWVLKEDLQIKFEGEGSRPALSKLEVVFRGTERRDGTEEIELVEQRKVLWGVGAAGSSSIPDGDGSGDFPPSSTRFKLDLTPDLPHCLHLPSSSLEYTLSAILSYADPSHPPIDKSAPVHLVRTSAPGASLLAGSLVVASTDLPPSTAPQTLSLAEPVPFSVCLSRTVFRRSEPIELLCRVEVPTAKAVQDGLRLRTVSAELVRKVLVGGVNAEDELPGTKTGEEMMRENGKRAEVLSNENDTEEVALPPQPQSPVHLTVLARSGKSCRFSPTRPVVIRLLLHPPAVISCESITQVRSSTSSSPFFLLTTSAQSTILHRISFEVRITVGLFSQSTSSRQDCLLTRTIFIVPDSPSTRTDKQREVETDAETLPHWMPDDGPVPAYHESAASSGEASGSWGGGASSTSFRAALWNSEREGEGYDGEEEYDGYEELSASLSTRAPPPTIDEDVSPPSATEDPPPSLDAPFARPDDSPPTFAPNPFPLDSADGSPPSHPTTPEPFLLDLSSLILPSSLHSSASSSTPPSPPSPIFVIPGLEASPNEECLPPPYGGTSPAVVVGTASGPPPYTSHSSGDLVGLTREGVLEMLRS